MSTNTVSAIYSNATRAENAIRMLKTYGHRDGEISLLASHSSFEKNIKLEENSKAPEGVSLGATIGGVLGATVAGLTAVGTVTLTGGLGLLAAGPIVAAFAGAGAGAGAGGLVGGLIGLGMPETEAKIVDERLGAGDVMVAVTVDNEDKGKTKDLLKASGASKVTVH